MYFFTSIFCSYSFFYISNEWQFYYQIPRTRHGRSWIYKVLPVQSVSITTDVVSSNLNQGEVYNIML